MGALRDDTKKQGCKILFGCVWLSIDKSSTASEIMADLRLKCSHKKNNFGASELPEDEGGHCIRAENNYSTCKRTERLLTWLRGQLTRQKCSDRDLKEPTTETAS